MYLSLSIQTPEVREQVPIALLTGTFEERLEKAASMGYDGVELITIEPAALDRAELRARLNQHGLKVSAIASGGMAFAAKLTLLNADASRATLARQRLDEMIDLAADIGAPVVTIGSFRGRTVGGIEKSTQELVEVVRHAGEHAATRGVRLALEPLNRYEGDLLHTADETLDFLNKLNQAAVGVLLDTYHMNIEECSWTEPYRRVMKSGKLFYAHVGDNNRLPPGQGLINFPAILRTLREIGYEGWLTAELLPRPDGDTAGRLTADAMRNWMREIQ